MKISQEIRSKIAQLDELATEIHEYLYEIEDDTKNLNEEQIEVRSELYSDLLNINDRITSLQESENWI